jgi:hypothetical protein
MFGLLRYMRRRLSPTNVDETMITLDLGKRSNSLKLFLSVAYKQIGRPRRAFSEVAGPDRGKIKITTTCLNSSGFGPNKILLDGWAREALRSNHNGFNGCVPLMPILP